MLKRSLIIFVLFPIFLNAQVKEECGNRMSPEQLQTHYARVRNMAKLLPHDTCLHRELSLVFHIVLDSNGVAGFPLSDIDSCVNKLNRIWKPICVKFLTCSLNYVPDYNYNEWEDVKHETPFFGNYFVDNTIDVVLVDNIVSPANAAGYAATMSHIVMMKSVLKSNTPVHEMGHLFGLPHTFEGPGELVKRTNCGTFGDGFCDTEADPHPQGEVPGGHCNFQAGPKDANNDYYTPPLDNFMTYFKACRCRFTQEQYNFMALTFILSGTQLH